MSSSKETTKQITQPTKLRAPHWINLKDIQRTSHGYNVKVKIIKIEK
jgi:hypothetical protein